MLTYEYIHKDDLAVFLLELKDNILYLSYSDETTCKLLGISYPYIDFKPIYQYIEDSLYQSMLAICNKLDIVYEAYRFTYFLPHKDRKIPLLINIISVIHKNSKQFLVCFSQIEHSICEQKDIFANELNRAYYNSTFDGLFTLQLTSNSNLLLLDYNKSFVDFFQFSEDNLASNHLKDLISFDAYNFFLGNSIIALASNSAISRLFNYFFYKDKRISLHLLITFIPVKTKESTNIVCCTRDVSNEMDTRRETRYLLEEYDALFNTNINAIAILVCTDPLHPQLERLNPSMENLYKRIPELLNLHYSEQKIWTQMLISKTTAEDTLTIPTNDLTYHFKLVLVPIFRNKKLVKVIATLINTTDQVISTTKKLVRLTPREDEIIKHVIAGEKNDFIAQKLNVSVGTIKRTLSNAYTKLGISSRVELINYYHSQNYNKT